MGASAAKKHLKAFAEFFDRLDGNGDGFIDREEAAALRRQFEEGGGPPGGPRAVVRGAPQA